MAQVPQEMKDFQDQMEDIQDSLEKKMRPIIKDQYQ